MSFYEIVVIIIVIILLVKPEDLPQILQKFKECKIFFINLKKDIAHHINQSLDLDSNKDYQENLNNEIEEINFYLEKIVNLGSEYNGEYSIKSVKKHYQQLIQEKIEEEKTRSKIKN